MVGLETKGNNEMTKTEIDNQCVILGDCTNLLDEIPKGTVDICVTSPPYNIGKKYGEDYDDNKKQQVYLDWIEIIFSKVSSILKPSGSLFLNVGGTNIKPWIPYDIANRLRKFLVLQNNIIWAKSISIDNDNIFGHYNPINSSRFLNNMFEHIFHFTKDGNNEIDRKSLGVPFKDKVNLQAKTVTEDIRCRGNIWFIPYETIRLKSEKGNHPAIFPKKLAEWCIKLHGFSKETIILDPFVGTGTTLLASRELNCNGIGIELVPEFYQYTVEKLIKTF